MKNCHFVWYILIKIEIKLLGLAPPHTPPLPHTPYRKKDGHVCLSIEEDRKTAFTSLVLYGPEKWSMIAVLVAWMGEFNKTVASKSTKTIARQKRQVDNKHLQISLQHPAETIIKSCLQHPAGGLWWKMSHYIVQMSQLILQVSAPIPFRKPEGQRLRKQRE